MEGLIRSIDSLHSLLNAPEVPVKAKGLPLKLGGSQHAIADQSPAWTSSAPESAPAFIPAAKCFRRRSKSMSGDG